MGNEKVSEDQFRERVAEIVRSHLTAVYHCTRVWSAWNVGTMGQDDFEPADESSTPEDIAVEVAREFDALAAELATLRAENARMRAALDDCEDYFDNRADVEDGDYGEPRANPEMRLLDIVRSAARTLPTGENKRA